jgi:ATPase subunit of ABC transporter with duplicated ATPase domains
MPEFIYSLRAVRKAHGDKVVLDNVTLSFLPGAKIGVVGPNGTGKSTLLKIMAGMEQASNGEARLMPGFTVGILAQEPVLNEEKTVLGNVEEGVAETKKILDEYNEIAEKMATDYSDELLEQMSKLTEQIEHKDAWDLDSQLEQAMDALRCPPLATGQGRHDPVRWRAAARRAVQAAAAAARPAAAGRAHQPPGRRVRAVARAAPGEVPRHGDRDHPR